ncbi:polymorphic toxin-type HINT domain-containing protein [Streptomyces sp. 2R]|uniref:polymorphic toxin-type HINT domain-containing protein n=1 Tax=Streptomyces sp. 2R TaxID=1883452 RepID=UPI00211B04AB|nr:polymorphic toxin-type HINT domain-containing protein [Streptomyces sp. 2R]
MVRRIAVAVSAGMVATLLQASAAPVTAAAATNLPGLPASEKPIAGKRINEVKPRAVDTGPQTPAAAPQAALPAPSTATIAVPTSTAKGAARLARPKHQPIAIGRTTAPGSGTSHKGSGNTQSAPAAPAKPTEVTSRILERKQAARAGVNGLLFTLTPQAPAAVDRAVQSRVEAPVALSVDYTAFAESYGGSYASRMRLVELPSCALTTPDRPECRDGTPVDATNDTAAQTLTANAVTLRAGTTTVLAAAAATAGDKGDYKATSLSPSSSWNTSLNTGDFNWSYNLQVPEVPGSLKPRLGLSYSSGSIDGRSGGTNNQGSWAGDGFDLWPGFIERRYKPCSEDGVKNADGNKPGDMCWAYDNAFISFNGSSGELIPAGKDEFRLKRDDGTRITRLESADRANGDNDNEYWRLTSPDGTQYYFGYNRLPGWAAGKPTTDSTWTLPVYGNNTGEKCNGTTFATSWCQQAWRWNVDYVVDPHGNAMSYHYAKETNSYGRNLKAADGTPYTRGGTLQRIDYGQRSNDLYTAKPLSQVVFNSAERCLPQTGVTCAADTIDTKAFYWYDTPWDLNCKAGTDCDNGRLSPSFWTRKRLTDITTQVLKPDGTYGKVDSWKLDHRWGMADTDYQLLLKSIQHTGESATPTLTGEPAAPAVTVPKTTFAYTQLANRLDKTGDGFAPFIKERLYAIDDESGGQISANYSAPVCNWNALPTPETNTTRCFPQFIGGSDTDPATEHWFNKYVTTSVTRTDRTGGSPDQVTNYQYLGDAAWHYADDDGLTKEKEKTWSQWRGYGQVRVKTGGQGGDTAMKTQQDSYFLRGMHGDRKTGSGDTKSVSITLATGEGAAITDHEAAAGYGYKTVTFDKPGGKILGKTVSRPWYHETAKKVRDWGTVTANLTGISGTKSWTSLDNGTGSVWRTTSTALKQETVAGRTIEADDFGDDATTADDRCTRTTYPPNTSGIITLPARVETVAKACSASVDRAKDVLSDSRAVYDGGAYGAAPVKGDVTATAILKSHDGSKATYLESGATYDTYGRQLTTTDLTANVTVTDSAPPVRTARTDGRTSTTAHIPPTGFATQVKTTTPPAKVADATTAQTVTTDIAPGRGLATKQTDTNGKVTEFKFDALGRTTKVWLADRRTSQTPTQQFDYTFAENTPVSVASRTLNNAGGQITSYTLYDGFLRDRQTQSPGPEGGTLVKDTFYDERGLAATAFAPYFVTDKPSTTIFKPDNALSVETHTRTTFDGLNRPIETSQIAGNGDGGAVLAITKTLYGGDRTTTIPPVGGTTTTTLTDARGNTTELRQHRTRAADSAFDTTRYHPTPRGQLSTVTDPAGNDWIYEYDQLGRQTKATDPDKGITTSTYNDRGQLTFSKGSRTDVPGLAYVYDNLGRQTEVREESTSGTLRTKQVYDTITGAKGQLAESTRYVNGNAYTAKVDAYDSLYRAFRTSVVIPAIEGKLQGTYQTGTAFHPSGLPGATNYSAAGSLPAGSFSYTYEDETLRPITVYGQGMTSSASYSYTGKPLQYAMGLTDSTKKAQVTNTYEWGTQRLSNSRVDRADQLGVDRYATYQYDEAGKVLSIADVSRSGTDNQCFTYDHLSRLTEAWTQPLTTCAPAPAGDKLGGPAPYWQSFTYENGNRKSEIRHDPTGNATKDITSNYTYPAPGSQRPHGVTSITTTGPAGSKTNSYGYDPAGNTTTRPNQSLTWDAEGHLATITENDKTTTYLYDTTGNRLIARTPTETTLYLGHTELTLTTGADKPKATRYVGIGGGHTAVRNDDGTFAFTVADHHSTGELAIQATNLALTQRRALPFGALRGATPTTWPGTKGFVGGTDDTKTTGLTHLGAREYDPDLGRFISVDPILDLADPQQMNGYNYANDNPVTLLDPDGLKPMATGGSAQDEDAYDRKNGTVTVPKPGKKFMPVADPYRAPQPHPKSSVNDLPYLGSNGKILPFPDKKRADFLEAYRANLAKSDRYIPGTRDEETSIKESIFFQTCHSGDFSCEDDLMAEHYVGAALEVGLDGNGGTRGAGRGGGKQGGKCPGKHSFIAGTRVLMADGTAKPVEQVKTGDKVLAADPKTGKSRAETVTAEIKGQGTKNLVLITITPSPSAKGEPKTITATDSHPFWDPESGEWADATDLAPAKWLQTESGARAQIANVHRWTQEAAVYNLTISNLHTYYVLAGQTPVLVHNSNGLCGPGFRSPSEAGIRPNDAKRIQNAADKTGQTIIVVGSRAGNGNLNPASDWDYILTGPSRSRSSVKNSLPQGMGDGEGGSGRGRDFYQSYNSNAKQYTELDRNRPYVVFAPRGR